MKNPVENWFGEKFETLDPLLQDLHRHGGELSGTVKLEFGVGLGALIGRRLAQKLDLPLVAGTHKFDVSITHTDSALHWSRCFDSHHKMVSVFVPHGTYPTGSWSETTGSLALILGVEVKDGGWYWIQREVRFLGIPLPLFLFPSSKAYKRINQGKYEFSVTFALPFIGKLVSYEGLLTPTVKIVP